jgi:phytoene/squalene synthetase
MFVLLRLNDPLKRVETANFAATITRAASKQTYYTIRLLVDRDRVQDAYRAYAYFRWVDDQLDCNSGTPEEKKLFLQRQQALLDAHYRKESPAILKTEEQMLADLVRNDHEKDSGLEIYLRNMMAVMAFDVERCGRVISKAELYHYSYLLSRAVTEALFYFIGHSDHSPCNGERYHAVCGAHIVHMLRDLVADLAVGYINIPNEVLEKEPRSLKGLQSVSFRKWVFERVKLAEGYLNNGRQYIAQVKNLRCRLAGYAYLARFEWMVRAIEMDGYFLRQHYPERKSIKAGVWMAWRVLLSLINVSWTKLKLSQQTDLIERCEER